MSSGGSFAAAQQRIQARQEARRQEATAAHQVQQRLANDSALGRLPFPLNRTAEPLTSLWTVLVDSRGTQPTVRVGQVDAELLDEELLTLLKSQIADALKYFNPHLQDDYAHETLLVLRAILFKLSIWDNDASYGASLQGLRYTDARKITSTGTLAKPSRAQKSLHGLITVLGRYAWDKYNDYLVEAESSYTGPSPLVQRLSRISSQLSTIHNIAAFTSFLVFLINGRYRTLVDRLLRLRLVTPNSQTHREVSFEYLNRQLVWHAFTEFLLFLLPLVGITRWRRMLSRAWRKFKTSVTSDPDSPHDHAEKEKHGPLAFLPERTCAICYAEQNPGTTSEAEVLGANVGAGGGIIGSVQTDIVNPYETMPCACIYCYVCLATKIEGEEGSGWSCLRCGETVTRCRPWRGDVLIEPAKNKDGAGRKTVGFAEEDVSDGRDDEAEETSHDADGVQEADTNDALESELGTSQWQEVAR
ncbi:peroxisome assembly protein (Peroxin-2) [Lithohypha guttulata]|uniref:RING-type E3 ubiquitin transferase (cysteine targeting) n=1 Tax=Lithohypha guttulata TaxID=1690604 RepID=A0AAN7YDQ8_9EURO|nr:peroxisome assembly protein (Peroxin-2) [Lithohypha guttulata]KAK5082044.1 peroxisome assembly protein (Peroxin-2) [Lithohypha guttulata]